MRQFKTIVCALILVFLLVGCTNTGNLRVEKPWCLLLGTAVVAAGTIMTGGIAAIAGGASVGRTLSLPLCFQEDEQEKTTSIEILDIDGDGIPNAENFCSLTPPGAAINKKGCPLDSDGDDIPDYIDKCLDTSKNATVDGVGCPYAIPQSKPSPLILENVYFESNSAELRTEVHAILDDVAAVLKKRSNIYVRIVGHTDNRGSKKYNIDLSKQRALSVMYCLIRKGVDPEILVPVGRGELLPIATNETAEGRQRNRRVVFSYSYQ